MQGEADNGRMRVVTRELVWARSIKVCDEVVRLSYHHSESSVCLLPCPTPSHSLWERRSRERRSRELREWIILEYLTLKLIDGLCLLELSTLSLASRHHDIPFQSYLLLLILLECRLHKFLLESSFLLHVTLTMSSVYLFLLRLNSRLLGSTLRCHSFLTLSMSMRGWD